MGKEGPADRLSPCKVDSAIASCSEMHDMKEAVHEAKKKLEGIGEDRQSQVPATSPRSTLRHAEPRGVSWGPSLASR